MAIDAAQLDIAIEEGENWRRTMKVTVPADLVSAERKKITSQLAKRVNMPGFRAGKTPASVIEKRFGGEVNRQVIDQVVGDAYQSALAEQTLRPISEGEVGDLKWEPDQDLIFEISFDVRPEIELKTVGGFKLERPASEVGDKEIDEVIERLREQNGAWEPGEEGHPAAVDMVSLTATQKEDGEPTGEPQEYDLVLGQGDAIEDVEAAVYTLEVGGSGDFTVTFPDDFPNEARRGLSQDLTLELRARKVRDLPEVNDEFAASVGEFESVEVLRTRIQEDLQKEAVQQAEGIVRGQLLDAILDANPFEVPTSMVDRYLDSVLGDGKGADPERLAQAREQVRPEAERAVKRMMVIETVAETQGLEADEDQIDDRVQEIAEANDLPAGQVYSQLQKDGRIEQLERELTEKAVFAWLEEQSEITTASA